MAMPQEKPTPYRTFLVRCWQEGEISADQDRRWRFWMEEIARERYQKGFSSLEALFAFFRAELSADNGKADDMPE
jgi:hypothetical protein